MKRMWSIFATLALAIGLSGAAYGQKHYVLSLSTWGSPKHPQVTQFVPSVREGSRAEKPRPNYVQGLRGR